MARVPARKNDKNEEKGQERALAARNPQHPMDLFRRQFDALFDQMWSGMLAPVGQGFGPSRMWDLGVTEGDNEVVVRAEMPGFDEKELDVRLEQNLLTIKAEKEHREEGREEYRNFYRVVTLPPGIDPDQARAEYHNGVLEMHIPRREEAQPKRIAIGQRTQQPAGEQSGNGHGQKAEKKQEAAQTEGPAK